MAADPVISPLEHSPEEYAAMIETSSPRLLEVRTGTGPIYVCPSGWERIRLEWVFRHFHVLPPELLSRGDRLMIERLTHSAAVATEEPVARSAVFGVVERAFPKAGRGPAPSGAANLPVSVPAHSPPRQPAREGITVVRELANWMIHRPARRRAQQWKGLAMLGVACLTIILIKNHDGQPVPASQSDSRSMTAPPAPSSPALGTPASRQDILDRGAATSAMEHAALPPAAPPRQAEQAGPAAGSRPLLLLRAKSVDSGNARDSLHRALRPSPSIRSASHAVLEAPPQVSAIAAMPNVAPAGAIPAEPAALTRPEAEAPAAAQLILSSSTHSSSARSSGDSAPSGTASGLQIAKAIASPAPALGSAPRPDPVRPFVSELPQSGFATPALSKSNFVGTVKLHVVIGADGSVKDVTVVSGDAGAARAAVTAVKGWHYSPHEVDGHAVEAESMVGISFFGRDAVSVQPLR